MKFPFFEWREAPPGDYAVVGDPIAHSLSPQIHRSFYKEFRLERDYFRIRVQDGELPQALDHLRKLGYRGVNVTVPHKVSAFSYCQVLDEKATLTGSVNCIELEGRKGYNTDWDGFLGGLELWTGLPTLVLGCGGSARTVVKALQSVGSQVHIWGRNPHKVKEFTNAIGDIGVASSLDTAGFSVVVNCTSTGHHGETLPIKWAAERGLAYDISYGKASEWFCQTARAAGWATVDGLTMLSGQAVAAFHLWEGIGPKHMNTLTYLMMPEMWASESVTTEAAIALKNGLPIGFPTETVYGIAASIKREDAIRRTFVVKGRPADHPLIVHVSRGEQVEELATEIPEYAAKLMLEFWPGPLTCVLKKQDWVPYVATGGLDTVAVRMPNHPLALKVIEELGCPVTAPSANSFTHLSPSRAQDIEPEIERQLSMVLDGGDCEIGIESTVVDCTGERPVMLRLGIISPVQIEEVAGIPLGSKADEEVKSPGMHPKHYAPTTPVVLTDKLATIQGGITFSKPTSSKQRQLPKDPRGYAHHFYRALHELDDLGLKAIYVESPPQEPGWEAIWDKLNRATHPQKD